jgi:hypothetical protein
MFLWREPRWPRSRITNHRATGQEHCADERFMARLQELQYKVVGDTKVVSGISLSPQHAQVSSLYTIAS